VYKLIEKLAWITGSLSLAGIILILFLQGMEKADTQLDDVAPRRPVIRLAASRPITFNRAERPVIVKAEPPKATPTPEEPKEEPPKSEEPKVETTKPVEVKKKETPPELTLKPRENERRAVRRQEPEDVEVPNNSGRLFAESELNQLVGKIQAEKIRRNTETNCIQIRITADNNNPQAVAQVERFLAARSYIITGREKEDFLRGSGLKVYAQGNCLKVTVGRK
jgi:outer membrane biosynthesis protein TonB